VLALKSESTGHSLPMSSLEEVDTMLTMATDKFTRKAYLFQRVSLHVRAIPHMLVKPRNPSKTNVCLASHLTAIDTQSITY